MKEFTDKMNRKVTFKNRLESFKINVKDYFEYDYKNKNGGEDPWEICLIRDGYRIASQAEELINHQKAEIESLKQIINEQDKEVLKLQNRIIFWRKNLNYQPEKIKSEAIKEFAERLKNTNSTMDKRIIPTERIDKLVKEMTEGK